MTTDRFESDRAEKTEDRVARGLALAGDHPDYAYLRAIEAALAPHDLKRFRYLYGARCRSHAGVRPATAMAVRMMRAEASRAIAGDAVPETWRSR